MFNKKPRRNFRQRKGDSSDEGDAQKNGSGDENAKPPSRAVNKPSKVSQGRGIACSSKREATPPRPENSGEEEGTRSVFTESAELDRRKGNAEAGLSFSDDREAEATEFKIKKSSDKAVVFKVRRKEGSLSKPTHSIAVPLGGSPLPSASPKEELSCQSSPCSSQHSEDGSDDNNKTEDGSPLSSTDSPEPSSVSAFKPVIVPDGKAIWAARRHRREARAQKEYISLGRNDGCSPASTPSRSSRDSDRDEEDDDEADDCDRRIEFAPRSKSIRERIAEKLGSSDGSASDSSEREERELWEETQILKGVKRRPGNQSPSGSEVSCYSDSSHGRNRQKPKRSSAASNIPKKLPPVNVSLVKKRIRAKLDSLVEVHRARQAELRRMEGDVENARASLENLEDSASEKQLSFYRSMTLYVHNLVECLQEKVVEINSLELEVHTLMSDQAEALLTHRRTTTREEAARLQRLSYGANEQDEGKADEALIEHETGEVCEDVPEDVQPSAEEEEQLQIKQGDVLSRSEAVFADVQEDFCDVEKILSRFVKWRGAYAESYHSAYITLCLPKLLSPVIRHQLLAWNPLKDSCVEFEELPWYRALETFCHGQGYEELEHTDTQTLTSVIEKTVLSKMTTFVELVWDPLSLHQSACLSDICHKLDEDYSVFSGERSKLAKVFVETVVGRLRSCVDEDVFIPMYPKRFLEDRLSPQCHFRDQQFWAAVKILNNMGKWDLVLPESVLKELMLDKLLNRYLMITLLNHTPSQNTVHTCRKIADSLPASWFKEESVSPPQLESFRNHLVQTAHFICKQQPPEEPDTRSAVVEVLQVLSKIRSFDAIMAIAEKYKYQDLIYTHQLLAQDAS